MLEIKLYLPSSVTFISHSQSYPSSFELCKTLKTIMCYIKRILIINLVLKADDQLLIMWMQTDQKPTICYIFKVSGLFLKTTFIDLEKLFDSV